VARAEFDVSFNMEEDKYFPSAEIESRDLRIDKIIQSSDQGSLCADGGNNGEILSRAR